MNMLDFFLNCFVTTTAVCVLSIWCKELIQLGTALWLAPRFGFKVKHFNLFHIHFENENGKWVTTKGKFSYLIQPLITIDLDQYTTPEENEQKEKQLEALRIAILIAISVLLTILCLGPIRRVTAGEYGVMDCFLTAFCTGMCLHSLTTLGIRLYVYGVMMKKMLGYIQTLGNRLRAGESFTTMQIPPIEQLPYENPTQMEKMFYYNYYLSAMVMQDNTEAMRKPIHEMTTYFRDRDYIIQETMSYYWLIFYYSRYELNPAAATHFLNKIRQSIENDKDANAKRVLAYYAFGVEQDFAKARRYVDEAYLIVNNFSSHAEREVEYKLLDELNRYLRKKNS